MAKIKTAKSFAFIKTLLILAVPIYIFRNFAFRNLRFDKKYIEEKGIQFLNATRELNGYEIEY